MALVVCNQGEAIMLENIINKTAAENLVLRLYSNDVTPGETDTELTYTEVTGNGYAAINVPPADWDAAVAGDPSYIQTTAAKSFVFTGAAGNVYGYYITQVTSGKLVWAERFTGAPFNIVNNGDKIDITPRIELA